MSCLYILEINPLSVTSLANIFSHSVGCLFILFMVSFAMKNLLSLIRSHLFIFCFHYSWRWIKKLLLSLCKRVFCLCFPLGVFVVSSLKCSSLIHFGFIFVYGVRKCSSFILLQVIDQFSQHHLLKRCLFSIVYSSLLCQR